MSSNRSNERNRDEEESSSSWGAWGAMAVGLTGLAATGLYLFTRNSSQPASRSSNQQAANTSHRADSRSASSTDSPLPDNNNSDYLSSLFRKIEIPSSALAPSRRGTPRSSVPDNPSLTNLNALLSDIYVRYVALDADEFEHHYKVFSTFIRKIHKTMKQVDLYYNKYSSSLSFSGSHLDGLRIDKPNEFDMDIVIGLPLNLYEDPIDAAKSDIVLEAIAPAFVQLKMGVQFQALYKRDVEDWKINVTAYEWKDESNYLLRSNFIDWFKGVISKALNQFDRNGNLPLFYVDGVKYLIRGSESGPAATFKIEDESRRFNLHVDLVPALKLPEARWPISRKYRDIPSECRRGMWKVVPKPNKGAQNPRVDKSRSWRIALHDQEKKLMYNKENLKTSIKLIKKLRNSLGMNAIASYYIKSLFYWELEENSDSTFWRKSLADLFKFMVRKFHGALLKQNIPYYWNPAYNLIGHIDRSTLVAYANKLPRLIEFLDDKDEFRQVAKYLLSAAEFQVYNNRFLHI